MRVGDAKQAAREWVQENAGKVDDFKGAVFHGSVNGLGDQEELPAESDVDVLILVDGTVAPEKIGKIAYRGVLLDISFLPYEQVREATQVLGVPHLAGSFRRGCLIADPGGALGPLAAEVSAAYARREWVERRCAFSRQKVLDHLQGFDSAQPLATQAFHWLFGAGVTTHLLLAAGLRNPTVRTRYLAARALLDEYGMLWLYEDLLDLLGSARASREGALARLSALESLFDDASRVIRSPFPFAADLTPQARPVAIDGSRALIERGFHREAMFWVAVTATRCMQVLDRDASPPEFSRHAPAYRVLLADLGVHSAADIAARCARVRISLPRIWAAAQSIIAANPAVES